MTPFPPADPIVSNVVKTMLGLDQVLQIKVEALKIELKNRILLMMKKEIIID